MVTMEDNYTIIKNADQYKEYCIQLEDLLTGEITEQVQDEIDLLTLLIEKYDEDQNSVQVSNPITLLRSFMVDHQMKAQDLTSILGISKGYVSDILSYKKGLSKDVIRKLAEYFKVRQEAFNSPYNLL